MGTSSEKNSLLAGQARGFFAQKAARALPELAKSVQDALQSLADEPSSAPEMQERRDGLMAFQKSGSLWVRATSQAWTKATELPVSTPNPFRFADSGKLELMGNEVMEEKILASRLALRVLDFVSWELNDLRLRVQYLDDVPELHKRDVLRPEVLAQHLVEQWAHAMLPRELWVTVQDLIQKNLGGQLLEVYHATNEFLVQRGVMAEIDLRPLVKRTPSAPGTAISSAPDAGADESERDSGDASATNVAGGRQGRGYDGAGGPSSARGFGAAGGGAGTGGARGPGGAFGGSGGEAGGANFSNRGTQVQDETRLETATTPLSRARMRAQGVMGQLKRLLSNQVAGFDDTRGNQPSPQLAQAMASVAQSTQAAGVDRTVLADAPGQVYGQAQVDEAAGVLRERTNTLKKAATTSSEKATIEIVALMFQSILSEDRIPAAMRVWFARLQMPVLRVAIGEPEFFESLQHPARRLIDRMGACALGFEATVSGGALESEVRRIVQVIEQYPETGRRVFQLVYDEFDKFLSKFLSEQGSAARVATVAQQVEQKETMTIQYTIEMRKMLNDMPVREEIREFLFKVWAEVLSIAAMKNGAQHEETITLKRAAADLVWAASAKPNRSDRARVIADLPKLLQLLRTGMSMLGLSVPDQDAHLKIISDTLADAFMSKTDPIALEKVEAMAKRLANLEDYLSDEDVGDLPLDTESLVTMIGLDSADIEVIADGGSQPTDAMRAWAAEIQLGTWFSLDHNGKLTQVQFAWCSTRKQLHLFASVDGRHFLIQARRLAAYLQAGLLVPIEEEALTVRATRDALAKLDANPERLLG